MRAWLLPAMGSIDNLRLENIEVAKPRTGEVTLTVLIAALNPADRYLAEGLYPAKPAWPHILGRDAVGIVEQVGEGVHDWRVGDKALLLRGEAGVSRPGTLAEKVNVPADCLQAVPPGWSDQQAACAALVYATAYQALTQWGDWPSGNPASTAVLISGATGGVGVAATQLANAMGHVVIGLTRSDEKARSLLELGARHVLNSSKDNWSAEVKRLLHPQRVNLAIDNIGGTLLPQMIDTMAMWGCVSVVGMLSGAVPSFNTASLFFRRIRIGGVAVGSYTLAENREAWNSALSLLNRTQQKPVIDSVFPFDQLPAAFARLAAGPLGKVLVQVAN